MYRKGRSEDGDITVYNCATGTVNPIYWGQFFTYGLAAVRNYPTDQLIWYPDVSLSTNDTLYKITAALYHNVPASIFDWVAQLRGKKAYMV